MIEQQHDQTGEEHANAVGKDAAAIELALANGDIVDPTDLDQRVVVNPPVRKPM